MPLLSRVPRFRRTPQQPPRRLRHLHGAVSLVINVLESMVSVHFFFSRLLDPLPKSPMAKSSFHCQQIQGTGSILSQHRRGAMDRRTNCSIGNVKDQSFIHCFCAISNVWNYYYRRTSTQVNPLPEFSPSLHSADFPCSCVELWFCVIVLIVERRSC